MSNVGNAIVALGTEGLQYMNAVTNNVYPTSAITTTPGGPLVTAGYTGTGNIVVIGLLAVAVIFFLIFVLK